VTLLLAAAVTATAVAAAVILHELRPAQAFVFVSREAIGIEPDPIPNWWECGTDQACLDRATGTGPQPIWVYSLDPEGSDGPQVVATVQLNRGDTPGAPDVSTDGRFVSFSVPGTPTSCGVEGLSLSDIRTGSTQTLDNTNALSWSPVGHSLLMQTQQCDSVTGEAPGLTVAVLDAETGVTRPIIHQSWDNRAPEEQIYPVGWLGNDRTLLIARSRECYRVFYCPFAGTEYLQVDLDASGTALTPLTSLSNLSIAGVSPDGRTLLVSSDNGATTALMGLDGSNVRSLGDACMNTTNWSNDGRYLTYRECPTYDQQTGQVLSADTSIVIVNVADGSSRVIGQARDSGQGDFGTEPAFAPDDSAVFWSDLVGTWTVKPDGSELTKLDLPPNTTLIWGFAGH